MKRKYLLTASLAAAGVIGIALVGTAMAQQGGMMGGYNGHGYGGYGGYGGQAMSGGMTTPQGMMGGWGGPRSGGHTMTGQGMTGLGMTGLGITGQGMMEFGMTGLGTTNGANDTALTPERVKTMLEGRLAWTGNPNLKVGEVKVKDDKTITAEIVTKDNSLVKRLEFDRKTRALHPTK